MTQPGVSFSDHDDAASALGARVRARARELGFDAVAVARADVSLERDVERYEAFVAAGMHGEMTWLARHRGARARLDGEAILAGAKSVVCLARRYQRPPAEERDDSETARGIARYARGRDYHGFLRQRVRRLAVFIRSLGSPGHPVQARPLCDDAPVLERAWASRAGLGFVGKNGMLIVPGVGSMVLLGEVVTTLAPRSGRADGRPLRRLQALSRRLPDGRLRRSVRARPATLRLVPDDRAPERGGRRAPGGPRRAPLRLRRLPDGVPLQRRRECARAAAGRRRRPLRSSRALVADRIWSRSSRSTTKGWEAASQGTPVKRAGRAGLARNAALVLGNRGDRSALPALRAAAAGHDDAVVREAAAWALKRIP